MFLGHIAVGLAAKQREPSVNVAWFVAAGTALDLLWPFFVLAGVETLRVQPGATAFTPLIFESYPWTHSLVMAVVWGLVLAAIARAARVPASAAPLLVMLVVSHWILDYITHAPDMPLWPGNSPRLGLTLWNSIPGTMVVEGAMWVAAIVIYVRARAATGERPGWPFWSFIALCTLMFVTSPFQAPPPTPRAVGIFALLGWIVVPWTAWADRRTRRGAEN